MRSCARGCLVSRSLGSTESVQQVERVQNDIAELKRQIGEMQVREVANTQQLHDEIQRQHGEIQQLQGEFQSKDLQLQQQERHLRGEIDSRERHFRGEIDSQERRLQKLNQKLKEQEQVTAEIQQTNHSLQRQVEQLQQQLSQQTQQNTKPSQPPTLVPLQAQVRGREFQQDHSMKLKQSQPSLQQVHLQKPHPSTEQMILGEWKDGKKAPIEMD